MVLLSIKFSSMMFQNPRIPSWPSYQDHPPGEIHQCVKRCFLYHLIWSVGLKKWIRWFLYHLIWSINWLRFSLPLQILSVFLLLLLLLPQLHHPLVKVIVHLKYLQQRNSRDDRRLDLVEFQVISHNWAAQPKTKSQVHIVSVVPGADKGVYQGNRQTRPGPFSQVYVGFFLSELVCMSYRQ